MYETDKLKHIRLPDERSICFACLSSNRNLTSISELNEYPDILRNITNVSLQLSMDLKLCWECVAILARIRIFKSNVKKAQEILAYHLAQNQKKILSLSRLSITQTNNIIYITHNEINIDNKQINTIKEEKNNFNDLNSDRDDAPSDHCIEEIKKENEPQIKCVKKNKVTHYRIVYGPNVFEKRLLRKKILIKPEEVSLWLEREKESSFFKSFSYKCKMCYEGYNSEEKLKKHYLECHEKGVGAYICTLCNSRFDSQSRLSAHIHDHRVAYECVRCGFQCHSLKRINAHIESHRVIQCVYCGLNLPNVRVFRKHYKSLHSVFLCDHCGKSCRTKYMLEKHMSHHVSSHVCQCCSRQYLSRAALNKHRATKHATQISPEHAYCARCDKQFDSVLVYRRHVLNTNAHMNERDQLVKKVPCPECGNTYSRRAYMMNHFRHVHMNQSKHYCGQCDRHFLNRTRFVEHMRYNHEGAKREKNKLCNICGRGFATNRILLNHIRTHSGERPFECEYCAAKFTQKHSMLSHIKYIHLRSKRRGAWQQ